MKNKFCSIAHIFSFLFLALAVSCGDDNPVGSNPAVSGNYVVESMTVSESGISVTVGPPELTGTLSLQSNGRYILTFSAPSEGLSESVSGTFEVSGNTINFDDGTRGAFNGTNTVTISIADAGVTYTVVYKKA